ncbi:hypothetical protein [Vibrio phage 2 TSL-2019]|uniref:Uncharacterized protein n=1 Tax=Vibrio phage 2 TSL-2019 TaxID=2508172 RepID=A0A513PW57_9CAUD|nr:hypothetical protein HWC03_gp017 [Vibrio phage 2 TSL-2019]QAU04172.1 hypothetical protein [Vibrio phage 2 TSL-2019]
MDVKSRSKVSNALLPVINGWIELATFTDAKELKTKHQGRKDIITFTLPWDAEKQISIKAVSVDDVNFTVVVSGLYYLGLNDLCINLLGEDVQYNEDLEDLRRQAYRRVNDLYHLAKEEPELLPEFTFNITHRHFTVKHSSISDVGVAFIPNKYGEI